MTDVGDLPFHSYKSAMVRIYGAPLYRVPIDLGHGCPHRDANGGGGCTFCAVDGGRAMQTRQAQTLEDQVLRGVDFARRRYGADHFMAYVQAFTGTWASVEEQEAAFRKLLALHPFDALTIGTRPDCLPTPTLDLLSQLRDRTDVWVELGIQTTHDPTLARIHRGHDWAASRDAVLALDARGIRPVAHVILGLPGETETHFHETAERLAELPLQGIKIHNLHVIRGTALATGFRNRPFPVYDEHEYAEILIEFLRRLPPQWPILRLNTDTPDEELIAPRWFLRKGQFLSYVTEQMTRRGLRQGDLLRRALPATQVCGYVGV